MISKHVTASSFLHTCRYIGVKPGADLLIIEGVRAYDYKLMADDFLLQQQLRPSKTQACMHAILSFYPGEKPSDELMKTIALDYLKELGIVETQYAVTKHTDKAHLHLHIVANMVNNKGKAISDSWLGYKGKKAAQRLTQQYQLTPAMDKNLQLTHLEALSQTEAMRYKIYIAIAEQLPFCKTIEDLERLLATQKITVQYKLKSNTEERQGISFKVGEFSFKGSKVDRKFSYAGLVNTLALQKSETLKREQKQQGAAAEYPNNKLHHQVPQRNNPAHTLLHKNTHTKSLLEKLMKPEQQEDNIPYELQKDNHPVKRKRRSMGL